MFWRPPRLPLLGNAGLLNRRSPPPDRLSHADRHRVAITELTHRNSRCATRLQFLGLAEPSPHEN